MSSGLPFDFRKRYLRLLQGIEAGGGMALTPMSQTERNDAAELKNAGYLSLLDPLATYRFPDGHEVIGPAYGITPKGREFIQQLREEERNMNLSADMGLLVASKPRTLDSPVQKDFIMPTEHHHGPSIFISHRTPDAKIAETFRNFLVGTYNRVCPVQVFLSSLDGISAGDVDLERMSDEIQKASVVVSLISPNSLCRRDWVLFETGAAWILNKKFIPICIGGLKKTEIPAAFYFRKQIKEASQERELTDIIASIGEGLGNLQSRNPISELLKAFQEYKVDLKDMPISSCEDNEVANEILNAFRYMGPDSLGIMAELYRARTDPVHIEDYGACVYKLQQKGLIIPSSYKNQTDCYEITSSMCNFIDSHEEIRKKLVAIIIDRRQLDDSDMPF